jgi:hypothetical protein
MSSTNRGAERREHDFYSTPEWCTRALFEHLPMLQERLVLDPCAGDGAILKVAQGYRLETHGIELRDVPMPEGATTWWAGRDALLSQQSEVYGYRFSNIVTNPPYSLAQEFIEAWRDRVHFSAWLLRLNFLGSQKRAAWFRQRPPARVLILPRRPSFTGGATDSCEYAWMVWDAPEYTDSTKLEWLEVSP